MIFFYLKTKKSAAAVRWMELVMPAERKVLKMKNRIDVLIDRTRDAILTGDGSPDCQHIINKEILIVLEEINKILKPVSVICVKGSYWHNAVIRRGH